MKNIQDKIRSKGLKATSQRIAVYQILEELGHTSADVIIERVKIKCPSLTVATVYNILESFSQAGLINRLSSSNVKMYYDVNTFPHCHLYSISDQKYEDFVDKKLTLMITDYLSDKHIEGFRMKGVEVHILGEFT